MKFKRTCVMKVQVEDLGKPDNTVVIGHPLTVEFEITRNTLASANTGRFTIYNLKEETRRKIFHDRYDTLRYRRIVFQAGYQDQRPLPIAFQGNIMSANSQRRGRDWVTAIEAFDGGFGIVNSQISTTLPAGTTVRSALQTALKSLLNVSPGVVGDFRTDSSRGMSFMGSSWDLINRIAEGGDAEAFIDNEKANVLPRGSYLANAQGIALLTGDTGLLNTPRRHDARIDVDVLFEPRAAVGQLVRVKSLETVNNGQYKVVGVTHRGTISGAMDGGVVSTLSLWAGTGLLKAAV